MTIIVAIFDVASDMDRAIQELTDRGLDETALDQSIESPQDFRTHLADHHLPTRVIDSYLVNFKHGGKFVIVKVEKERAAEVMDLIKTNNPAQLNRARLSDLIRSDRCVRCDWRRTRHGQTQKARCLARYPDRGCVSGAADRPRSFNAASNGENGVGKSTLVKSIVGLPPTRQRILRVEGPGPTDGIHCREY